MPRCSEGNVIRLTEGMRGVKNILPQPRNYVSASRYQFRYPLFVEANPVNCKER